MTKLVLDYPTAHGVFTCALVAEGGVRTTEADGRVWVLLWGSDCTGKTNEEGQVSRRAEARGSQGGGRQREPGFQGRQICEFEPGKSASKKLVPLAKKNSSDP